MTASIPWLQSVLNKVTYIIIIIIIITYLLQVSCHSVAVVLTLVTNKNEYT